MKEITVVSETITTHEYESKTLAKAFEEITGIKVKHDLIQEGDVVEKLQTSMQSGKSIYDGWITDSRPDRHALPLRQVMTLSDYMAGEGKEFTNPGLDLKDFIGTKFTTAPDGKLYQLPDQQFANLYWFRADLFARQDLQDKFKAKYGYDLGVPLNWTAYEDIAEFFTNDVKEIDGKPIYGHMDYGKKDPSLGWRFTDAWLSMAGTADKGIPNGLPVDEWGIRVADDKCTPVGASVSRGGATNSPAAVYALTKYVDWMKKYAPQGGHRHDLRRGRPGAGAGPDRAADLLVHGLHRRHDQDGPAGGQRRRHAQVAHGARPERPVLEGGHAERLPGRRLVDLLRQTTTPTSTAAAWLYAQFVTAKTTSLKKSIVGLTPIRESRHPDRGHDRHGAQARRPGRVLPQPGARGLDAHRHQRARLPEAGAAVVEERGAGGDGREDAAGRDGHPGRGDGPGAGAAGARGHGQLRAQAQRQGRPGEVAERQGRAVGEAGQREAQGRDDRLRQAAAGVEGRQGALTAPEPACIVSLVRCCASRPRGVRRAAGLFLPLSSRAGPRTRPSRCGRPAAIGLEGVAPADMWRPVRSPAPRRARTFGVADEQPSRPATSAGSIGAAHLAAQVGSAAALHPGGARRSVDKTGSACRNLDSATLPSAQCLPTPYRPEAAVVAAPPAVAAGRAGLGRGRRAGRAGPGWMPCAAIRRRSGRWKAC